MIKSLWAMLRSLEFILRGMRSTGRILQLEQQNQIMTCRKLILSVVRLDGRCVCQEARRKLPGSK